jgi:hypothetical protein
MLELAMRETCWVPATLSAGHLDFPSKGGKFKNEQECLEFLRRKGTPPLEAVHTTWLIRIGQKDYVRKMVRTWLLAINRNPKVHLHEEDEWVFLRGNVLMTPYKVGRQCFTAEQLENLSAPIRAAVLGFKERQRRRFETYQRRLARVAELPIEISVKILRYAVYLHFSSA